jgi:hypothetical protein
MGVHHIIRGLIPSDLYPDPGYYAFLTAPRFFTAHIEFHSALPIAIKPGEANRLIKIHVKHAE